MVACMVSGQTSKTKQDRSSDLCIGETGNEAQTSGQRTSLRDEKPVFPLEGPPALTETHTFPERNGLFLGTQSLFCISHLFDHSALRGETGFLSENRRPSQPIISVLEIHWRLPVNRPHPARDPARLLNGPMNICIILLSAYTKPFLFYQEVNLFCW